MPTIGSIRLVGAYLDGHGVVEILSGIGWSTIFPNSHWRDEVSTSMCQYLGYELGTASFVRQIDRLLTPNLLADSILCFLAKSFRTSFL